MSRNHKLVGLSEALMVVAVLMTMAACFIIGMRGATAKTCPEVKGERVVTTSYVDGNHYCTYSRTYAKQLNRRRI